MYVASNNIIMQFYSKFLYFHKRKFIIGYFTFIEHIWNYYYICNYKN